MDALLCSSGKGSDISIGICVCVLGFAAGTGAYEEDEGVFKRIVAGKQGLIGFLVLGGKAVLVLCKPFVQETFLLLLSGRQALSWFHSPLQQYETAPFYEYLGWNGGSRKADFADPYNYPLCWRRLCSHFLMLETASRFEMRATIPSKATGSIKRYLRLSLFIIIPYPPKEKVCFTGK